MNHLIKLLLPIFIVGFLTSPLVGDEKDYNSNQTNLIRKMKGVNIPSLSFEDVDFSEALDHMRKISEDINLVVIPHRAMHHLDVTLTLKNISFFDALGYLLEVCRLNMRIDDNAVVILPRDDWHDEDEDCDDDDDDDDDDWF